MANERLARRLHAVDDRLGGNELVVVCWRELVRGQLARGRQLPRAEPREERPRGEDGRDGEEVGRSRAAYSQFECVFQPTLEIPKPRMVCNHRGLSGRAVHMAKP